MAEKEKNEEGEAEQAAPAARANSGKSKKLLMIGGFLFLLVLAAGVPTVFLVMKQRAAAAAEAAAAALQTAQDAGSLTPESAGDDEELGENEERLGMIAPMETFVVNLSGGKYLRAQVQVEFQEAETPMKFLSHSVPIRDAVISLLTKKTESELSSTKGKDDLKTEIKDLVNEQMHKEDVKRVYFTQFVIE